MMQNSHHFNISIRYINGENEIIEANDVLEDKGMIVIRKEESRFYIPISSIICMEVKKTNNKEAVNNQLTCKDCIYFSNRKGLLRCIKGNFQLYSTEPCENFDKRQ